MLIRELNCVEDMIIICSMLSVENVFYKPKLRKSQYLKQQQLLPRSNNITLKANKYNPYGPGGNQQQEEEKGHTAEDVERDRVTRQLTVEEERIEIAHSGLKHEYGDFLTLWNIFKMWEKSDFTYEWCERNYINYRSMKTSRKIRYISYSLIFSLLKSIFLIGIIYQKRLAVFDSMNLLHNTSHHHHQILHPPPQKIQSLFLWTKDYVMR